MNSFDKWLRENADECTEEEYLELMCGNPNPRKQRR